MQKELTEIRKEEAETVDCAREDATLKIIASREDFGRFALLIYGKSHNFISAVEKHNKTNPNKKFGLISLLPNEKEGKINNLTWRLGDL